MCGSPNRNSSILHRDYKEEHATRCQLCISYLSPANEHTYNMSSFANNPHLDDYIPWLPNKRTGIFEYTYPKLMTHFCQYIRFRVEPERKHILVVAPLHIAPNFCFQLELERLHGEPDKWDAALRCVRASNAPHGDRAQVDCCVRFRAIEKNLHEIQRPENNTLEYSAIDDGEPVWKGWTPTERHWFQVSPYGDYAGVVLFSGRALREHQAYECVIDIKRVRMVTWYTEPKPEPVAEKPTHAAEIYIYGAVVSIALLVWFVCQQVTSSDAFRTLLQSCSTVLLGGLSKQLRHIVAAIDDAQR